MVNTHVLADLAADTASTRYATGAGDQAAVLTAQFERTRLGGRLDDVRAERRVAQTELNRLAHDAADTLVGTIGTLVDLGSPPASADAASLVDRAGKMAARVAVRRAETEAARAHLAAARLGCRVGCPMVIDAEREAEAAELDLESAVAEARSAATASIIRWRLAHDQIERYRTAIVPQASAARPATFLAVAASNDVRTELARREAARFVACIRLCVLVAPPQGGRWRWPAGGLTTAGRPERRP